MKIGLYSPYLDTFGGGEKYILTAALALAKENEVTLFWDATPKDVIRVGSKERFNLDIASLLFVDNIFSPHVSFTKRLRESKKYDAIIVLSDGSIPLVQTRLFLHFQSPITWVNRSSLKNRLKMKRVTKVFCNSQFTKSFIDTTYHCNSRVIYPPVEIQSKYHTEKENIILNVGRFGITEVGSSFKKQEVMMQAFREMVDAGLRKWTLFFVMNMKGDNAEKMLEELKKENTGYPIEFITNPSFNELWELYGRAKLYWHAAGYGEDIDHHPDRAEHFGISTVESMGMGAVPIVINAGGQKEIVTHGENGYLWKTIEELKDYTLSLITDEKQRSLLSRSAEKRADMFGLDSFSNEINALLR